MPAAPLPITVVVPVYNAVPELLGEALASALAQDPPLAQVVVVDDGSPVSPDPVLARFPQVELVRQENRGVGVARNEGLRRADTEYVLFLDQDDRILPGALQHAVRLLEGAPDAAFVSGRSRTVRADGGAWETAERPRPRVDSDHYRELLRHTWIVPPAAVVFRRDVLAKSGGWSEDRLMRGADDYELYLRMAREHPVLDTEEVYVDYRMHGGNTSSDAAKILAGITYVLEGERPYTQDDPALENARLEGLRFWQSHLGIKAAGQELVRALRTHRGVVPALTQVAGTTARHPQQVTRLVAQHVLGASKRADGRGLKAIVSETRRRLG